MLNEERKSLNKTKMFSVWSGKMQQQKSVTKFGVTNLSIQIVICQDVASLSFSKNMYALATMAAVGHITKFVRWLVGKGPQLGWLP